MLVKTELETGRDDADDLKSAFDFLHKYLNDEDFPLKGDTKKVFDMILDQFNDLKQS